MEECKLAEKVFIKTKNNCPNILADDFKEDIDVVAVYCMDLYREYPIRRVQYNRVFFCIVNGEKYRVKEVYKNNLDNYFGVGDAKAEILIEKVPKFHIKSFDYLNEEGGGTLYFPEGPTEQELQEIDKCGDCVHGHKNLFWAEDTVKTNGLDYLFGLVEFAGKDFVKLDIDTKGMESYRIFEDEYNKILEAKFGDDSKSTT